MIDAIDEVNGTAAFEYTTTPAKAAAPLDTVSLSETAQATLLQHDGLNAQEIADQLGISLATVQTDLDIAVTISQAKATNT